jgi:hypothetical protein
MEWFFYEFLGKSNQYDFFDCMIKTGGINLFLVFFFGLMLMLYGSYKMDQEFQRCDAMRPPSKKPRRIRRYN